MWDPSGDHVGSNSNPGSVVSRLVLPDVSSSSQRSKLFDADAMSDE
jgi:hypothetical protein